MVNRNILIVGDGGTGKTSYIRKLEEQIPHEEEYQDELYFCEKIVSFNLPQLGNVDVFDANVIPDDKNFLDAVIIMCDETPVNIDEYKNKIREKNGNIPIMILFNKYELNYTKINYDNYILNQPNDIVRICSVRQNFNLEETFMEIVTA